MEAYDTALTKALGHRKALIMRNQGLLTVAPTIEAVTLLFIRLEDVCMSQLLAYATVGSGGVKPVPIGMSFHCFGAG
jgi:hypothetical protein